MTGEFTLIKPIKIAFVLQFVLNKLLIQKKDYVMQNKQIHPKQWNFWLKSIFKYNNSLLASLAESDYAQIAEHIETILALYRSYLSPNLPDQFVHESWYYQISNHYFKNLRLFIDKISNTSIYSGFFESIYQDMLLSPLSMESLSPEHVHHFVRNFLLEFLPGPLSNPVKNVILPRIGNSLPVHLNASNIIDSFDFNAQSMNSYSFKVE